VLDQTIRYRYSAPVTNLRQRLKVVPPPVHGPQRRRRWDLTVRGVPSSTTRTFLDGFGNMTIEVLVPHVEDSVEFALDVEADTDAVGYRQDTAIDRRYLQPTLTAPDGRIAELAASWDGRQVETLCAQVHGCLTYEWGVTGVGTTASQALAGRRGVCQDYAHIMLGICRAAGLPARYVSGHLVGEGGSHAWVEVLRPHPYVRERWVADGWDPTRNRRTDADYLVVAVGRDYADTAPMSGTYAGRGTTNTLNVKKRLAVR
jgi:transglutaminase-like putative cysteine protease